MILFLSLHMKIPEKSGIVEIKFDMNNNLSTNSFFNITKSMNLQLTRN